MFKFSHYIVEAVSRAGVGRHSENTARAALESSKHLAWALEAGELQAIRVYHNILGFHFTVAGFAIAFDGFTVRSHEFR